MFEILSRLNVWNAILVGISFGGFISLKTLSFDEKRIAKAFLVTPAGILTGNSIRILRKIFLPIKHYKWHKKEIYIHHIIEELFTVQDEFALAYLSKVLFHFEIDLSPIPLITKEVARNIKTPLSIVAADHDLLFPGERMLHQAKKIFPSLDKVLRLKDSKHIPDQQGTEHITRWIKSHSKPL